MCARVYVHEVRRAWTTTCYAPRACIMYHASHRRTVNVQPTRGCRARTSDISSLDVGIR
ncbi:hypothetical protein ALC60_06075 [Trachymyrmex zeteki]|uniref:Uncharacterized protein n=1 Tax=Mycetomoellerius zeteki TaxID=64791 RepID=A0A151X3U5_9HYME|nr:hypothetical protein ALC60_06075 [Trachymyrmex zeteki]